MESTPKFFVAALQRRIFSSQPPGAGRHQTKCREYLVPTGATKNESRSTSGLRRSRRVIPQQPRPQRSQILGRAAHSRRPDRSIRSISTPQAPSKSPGAISWDKCQG